jgi:hypothetical protein
MGPLPLLNPNEVIIVIFSPLKTYLPCHGLNPWILGPMAGTITATLPDAPVHFNVGLLKNKAMAV